MKTMSEPQGPDLGARQTKSGASPLAAAVYLAGIVYVWGPAALQSVRRVRRGAAVRTV